MFQVFLHLARLHRGLPINLMESQKYFQAINSFPQEAGNAMRGGNSHL